MKTMSEDTVKRHESEWKTVSFISENDQETLKRIMRRKKNRHLKFRRALEKSYIKA